MGKILYALLAICIALLVYLRGGWEMDFSNMSLESAIVLVLIIAVLAIGAIFLSPYLNVRKLAFREGTIDRKKLFGGKDVRR